MTLAVAVREAYDAAGGSWAEGPMHLYRELARPLVAAAGEVTGRRAVDLGTGSGAVAGLLQAEGARVVACDGALGMLLPRRGERAPAVVADVRALPLASHSVDLVAAGFVLNHLPDPGPALREAARVLRPGGRLVGTTFAGEAASEVKRALGHVAARHGFVPPGWYAALHDAPLYQPTRAEAERVLASAGLRDVRAEVTVVRLRLSVEQVVAWRWGMAQLAAFVGGLTAAERAALDADAAAELRRLWPPEGLAALDFPVLVMSGRTPSAGQV